MSEVKEVHISSLVVYTSAEHLAQVATAIEAMPEAEIYARDDQGKLVVVIENEGKKHILNTVETINQLEHVLNTSLVYHQVEELVSQCEEAQ